MRITIAAIAFSFVLFIQDDFCRAEDEITKAVTSAKRVMEEAEKSTDAKVKDEKLNEARSILTNAVNKIIASGKVYTDEELAPLYTFRGLCNYDLRDYEKSLKDFTQSAKLNPEKITPWVQISMIKSSAPDDKLRDGKEALVAAERATKVFLAAWDAAMKEKDPLKGLQGIGSLGGYQAMCVEALAAAHAEAGDFKAAISHLKGSDVKNANQKIEQYRDAKPNRLPVQSKK